MDNLCNNNSSESVDSFVSNNRVDQDALSNFDSINEEIKSIEHNEAEYIADQNDSSNNSNCCKWGVSKRLRSK